MDTETELLTKGELAGLTAICDTLLPEIEGAEPTSLFGLPGSHLGLPLLMSQAFAALPDPAQQAQVKQLLGLFENRLANLVLAGRFRRFSELSAEARESYLLSWAHSALGQRRMAFQLLKRLACFLFYTAPIDSGNPAATALGYRIPSSSASHRPREIRLMDASGEETLEADVCVVGSGAGGAVVAAELAAAGQAVLLLEKGGYHDEADFHNSEFEGRRTLYMDDGLLATRDLGMMLLAGRCLGGGTVVNLCTCFRPPREILEEWERAHGVSGLLGPEMQASLDAVEARLNVNDRESNHNRNNQALVRGCTALGYHVGTIRRNVRGCKETGFCEYGCQESAKQSTLATYLRDAQRRGSAQILVNCAAERVRMVAGRVEGVEAVLTEPGTGRRQAIKVRAPIVVVAAGAIHSAALLLRSGLSHPALGRSLHLHPHAAVAGFFDEPIEPWSGVPQSAYSDEFSHLNGGYGFKMEAVAAHPGLAAIALAWPSGWAHKRDMLRLSRAANVFILPRDRDGGKVSLDRSGRPVVEYWPSTFDAASIIRGQYEGARVLAAAGAQEVVTLHTPPLRWRREEGEAGLRALGEALAREGVRPNRLMLFSAHQMGGCCMGGDSARAVVNPEGEVYGVRGLFVADGSVFPSASGVNPMITVMGLAHRTAQFIKSRVNSE